MKPFFVLHTAICLLQDQAHRTECMLDLKITIWIKLSSFEVSVWYICFQAPQAHKSSFFHQSLLSIRGQVLLTQKVLNDESHKFYSLTQHFLVDNAVRNNFLKHLLLKLPQLVQQLIFVTLVLKFGLWQSQKTTIDFHYATPWSLLCEKWQLHSWTQQR